MNRILFEASEISNGCATFGGVRAEHVLNVLHGEVGQMLKTGVVNGRVGTSRIEAIEPLPPSPETGLAPKPYIHNLPFPYKELHCYQWYRKSREKPQ